MTVEVDQSGKIGDTRVSTVVALANDLTHAILIPASVKRECLRALRSRGKQGTRLYIELFTVALFLLLREWIGGVSIVTIDMEYPGYENAIKEHLINLFRRSGVYISPHKIGFGFVGKSSSAHDKAIAVYRGQADPDYVVTAEDLLSEFR